jgi:hypothetical protein
LIARQAGDDKRDAGARIPQADNISELAEYAGARVCFPLGRSGRSLYERERFADPMDS